MFLYWIFMKLTPDIDFRKCLWHAPFQVKRSTAKVTGVIRSFCRFRSLSPCLFDWSALYLIDRSRGQSSMSHRSFGMKVTLAIRSFCCPAQRMKGQRSSSHGSFKVFTMPALWPRNYFTDSLHMRNTYDPRGREVSRNISRSNGQRWISHGSFEILSCPLRGFLLIGLNYFILGLHTTQEVATCRAPFPGWKVKGQGRTGRVVSNLGLVRSVASSLFDWITPYVAYTQHMRGRYVVHHFHVERLKVKIT